MQFLQLIKLKFTVSEEKSLTSGVTKYLLPSRTIIENTEVRGRSTKTV